MPKVQQTEVRSARASSRNRRRIDAITHELSLQNMGSRIVQQNIEQCSLFSNTWSEHDATNVSLAINGAGGNEALTSRGRSSAHINAENIRIAFKLNAITLDVEEP